MEIILATNNQHKVEEINLILNFHNNKLLTLNDINFHNDIIENGSTYNENSNIKADTIFKKITEKKIILADDSGLEIDFLDGAPGLHSARWGGKNLPQIEKNNKILEILKDTDNRKAKFISVVCCITPAGKTNYFKGVCEGNIIKSQKGNEGFGYDPIFIPNGFTKTFAELSGDIKNYISHRAIAFNLVKKHLIYSGLLD
jgi:XTP/dITP diphosphohydrolase